MTDAERLASMERAVKEIIGGRDIQIVRSDTELMIVGSRWNIVVQPPHVVRLPNDERWFFFPARLQFSGPMTPLALRVVMKLDELMWRDRQTEPDQ